jgi:hypothetical protein
MAPVWRPPHQMATTATLTTHNGPVFEFARAVEHMSRIGVDGSGEPQAYASPGALLDYWTQRRVGETTKANDVYIPRDVIRRSYIRVFSILVYSNRVSVLEQFTNHGLDDNLLPLVDFPSAWPNAPAYQELFAVFTVHQWRFCPLVFDGARLTNLHLHHKQILPIQKKPIVGTGGREASLVSKMELDQSCDMLQGRVRSEGMPAQVECC